MKRVKLVEFCDTSAVSGLRHLADVIEGQSSLAPGQIVALEPGARLEVTAHVEADGVAMFHVWTLRPHRLKLPPESAEKVRVLRMFDELAKRVTDGAEHGPDVDRCWVLGALIELKAAVERADRAATATRHGGGG